MADAPPPSSPVRAESPKMINDFNEIKHGFTDRAARVLEEYARYKAIMKPEDFERWIDEKVRQLEQDPQPKFEKIQGLDLKPVRFDDE